MGVPVRDRKVSAAALSTRRSLRPRRSRGKPGKRPRSGGGTARGRRSPPAPPAAAATVALRRHRPSASGNAPTGQSTHRGPAAQPLRALPPQAPRPLRAPGAQLRSAPPRQPVRRWAAPRPRPVT